MSKKDERGIIQVLLLLLLMIGLGLGVYLVQRQTQLKSHASLTGTRIEAIDSAGQVLSSITTPTVKLKVTYTPPVDSSLSKPEVYLKDCSNKGVVFGHRAPDNATGIDYTIKVLNSDGTQLREEKTSANFDGSIATKNSFRMGVVEYSTTNKYNLTASYKYGGQSSPSTNYDFKCQDYVTYSLVPGNNFIAVPLTPYHELTAQDFVEDYLQNKCDIVISEDKSLGGARAYYTDPSRKVLNNLNSIDAGKAYQIHCKEMVYFSLSGTPITTDPVVSEGYNYVAPARNTQLITPKDYLEKLSPTCTEISTLVPGGMVGETEPARYSYKKGESGVGNFSITDTTGYQVRCSSKITPASFDLTYSLVPNWNFIGLSVTPSESVMAKSLMSDSDKLAGKCDIIMGFDPAKGQALAYFTDPNRAILNSLTELKPGQGYQVHCTQAVSLTLKGSGVAPAVTLSSGWNMISGKKNSTKNAEGLLNDLGDKCEMIMRSIPGSLGNSQDSSSNQIYKKSEKGPTNFPVIENEGYWLKCADSASGSVLGVSNPGEALSPLYPVKFRVANCPQNSASACAEQLAKGTVYSVTGSETAVENWPLPNEQTKTYILVQFSFKEAPEESDWVETKATQELQLKIATPLGATKTVEYSLHKGSNLIGFPVLFSITPAQFLAEKTAGACHTLFGFNVEKQNAQTYFLDPSRAPLNNLSSLNPSSVQGKAGQAFYVICDRDAGVVKVEGRVADFEPATAGMQFITISENDNGIMASDFLARQASFCYNIYRLAPDGLTYYTRTEGTPNSQTNFAMHYLEGYMMRCRK